MTRMSGVINCQVAVLSQGTKNPGNDKLEKQGRYDEAIQMVLGRRKDGQSAPEDDSRVALLFLEQAKRDGGNRDKWAEKSASYSNKAVKSAPADPFILETAMLNMDRAGDYSENGCLLYEKAQGFGESALALAQGKPLRSTGGTTKRNKSEILSNP